MHVQLWTDSASLRRWHLDLVESLERRVDTSVSVRFAARRDQRLSAADRFLTFERRLHNEPRDASKRATVSSLDRYRASGHPVDLVLDLAGAEVPSEARTWRLSFDGTAGFDAAIAAVVDNHFPVVTIDDLRTGDQIVGGRPGSESPGIAVTSLEDVLARCNTLIHAALDGGVPRTAQTASSSTMPSASGLVRKGATEVASSLIHGVYRRAFRAPHWRVGWRFVDGDDVVDLGAHPADGWNDLPDDGQHFYADPFPIVVGGRTYLFVEDFDHRVGRGVISVVEFDRHGPLGVPEPVLSHDVHLSYPHVFEACGEVWLIPETSAARRVELYRATDFPSTWVRERVLLDDVQANDVTVFAHNDSWWMTATVTHGGSHSDALHVWYATDLTGPWTAHPGNPVVVDIATARPAGRVIARDGRLIRPVQDCTNGYGAALGLMQVTSLDERRFEQRPIAHLTPGPRWPGRRVHTLNRAGRLECIDGSRLAPRFRVRNKEVRRDSDPART